MRFSHKEEMARIKAEKSAKLAQTEATKATGLAQTETDRMTKLAQTEAIKVAKLAEIEAVKTTKSAEIETQKNIALTEIENNTQLALADIKRKEDFRIMELRADYAIKIKSLDISLRKFQERLWEESGRFKEQCKMARSEQEFRHKYIEDLQNLCRHLNKKIIKGKASAKEMDYDRCLLQLQIQAFAQGIDFVQSVITSISLRNAAYIFSVLIHI